MRRFPAALLGLLVWLATGANGWSEAGDETIYPGARIGKVVLTEREAQAIQTLGKPTDVGDEEMGSRLVTWLSKPRKDSPEEAVYVRSARDEKGKFEVRQIIVTSPFFKTRAGNSTRSDMGALWREFPGLRYVGTWEDHGDTHLDVYDSTPEDGVGFLIQTTMRPAAGQPWGKCRAVIVHRYYKEIVLGHLRLPAEVQP